MQGVFTSEAADALLEENIRNLYEAIPAILETEKDTAQVMVPITIKDYDISLEEIFVTFGEELEGVEITTQTIHLLEAENEFDLSDLMQDLSDVEIPCDNDLDLDTQGLVSSFMQKFQSPPESGKILVEVSNPNVVF